MLFQSSSISSAWCSRNLDWKIISILHTSQHLCILNAWIRRAESRPEQRLLVTALWKGTKAPCRSSCKLSLDWHKGGLGTYIFNRSGNRHKSGEVGCLQYECTEYCIWICHSSLHRGAPKRVKACQIAWGNYRAWSGAIYWDTTSSPSCPASPSTRAMTWPYKFVLLIHWPIHIDM